MTLGSMLTLCFQLDFERGRMNSKFDTAAASISKWTSKSIERRLGAMGASQCGNGRPGFGVHSVTQKLSAYNIIRV